MKEPKAKNILVTSGFQKISPQMTISSVYSKLRSAHDAVFVFDGKRFLGCLNLYYSLLKKRPKAKEKILNCLYHPPKIDLETPIFEIARLMVESRVYQLPVFSDGEKFVGVISQDKILRWALNLPQTRFQINEIFPPKIPIYIDLKDGIGKARTMMMNNKVNRLLVLDKNSNLVGIVSSYDLRSPFSSPVETIHFLSKSPIKTEISNLPIERYVNRNLIGIKETKSVKELIKTIIEEDIGSVLVFKKGKTLPKRLVSTRDILKFICGIHARNRTLVSSSFKKPFKDENKSQRRYWKSLFISLINKNQFLSNKIRDINLVFTTASLKGVKNPVVRIIAMAKDNKNQNFHVNAEGRNIFSIFKKIIIRFEKIFSRKFKNN